MKSTLSEFITELNLGKKSGLLSVTVKGANTLLKIFFRNGDIYHLTFGNCRGASCLEQAAGAEMSEYFFMPDVGLNVQDSDLPGVSSIVDLFRNQRAVGGAAQAATGSASAGRPSDAAMEKIKMAFVRQIGPAGVKVMSRIVGAKWNPPPSPSKDDYHRLIDLLKSEIENAADQGAFVKEAKSIL
jgi:hypothetical protein